MSRHTDFPAKWIHWKTNIHSDECSLLMLLMHFFVLIRFDRADINAVHAKAHKLTTNEHAWITICKISPFYHFISRESCMLYSVRRIRELTFVLESRRTSLRCSFSDSLAVGCQVIEFTTDANYFVCNNFWAKISIVCTMHVRWAKMHEYEWLEHE